MKLVTIAAFLFALTVPAQGYARPVGSGRSARRCSPYHGREFILCAESGGNMHIGNHPGPSSAAGPCGMLASTARRYGGYGMGACTRYMAARYGSWTAAERTHRARNYW